VIAQFSPKEEGEPGGIRSEAVISEVVNVVAIINVVAVCPEGANRSLIYVMVKP
jgi:hypothetical protein